MPFCCYKYVKLIRGRDISIARAIDTALFTYCCFSILSFVVNFRILPKKEGYFGLIRAGNDLIILYVLALFYYFHFREHRHRELMLNIVAISLLLTNSKVAILSIAILIVLEVIRRRSGTVRIVLILVAVLLCMVLLRRYFGSLAMLAVILYDLDVGHLVNSTNLILSLLSVVTYGRIGMASIAFENSERSVVELLVGIGQSRSAEAMNGRVGIEMDILDSINIYGLVGLLFLLFFYYLPIMKSKVDLNDKLMFLIVIAYSAFGGHFYNNPLVGTVYGVMLGLIENEGVALREETSSNYRA